MSKNYQKSLPAGKNAGFMLIELLVVVLIIGILAAVAVPQYEKAVMKSRMNSIFPLLKSIKDAQEVYYLANGEYTGDLTKLDVIIPTGDIRSIPTMGIEAYSNGTCLDNLGDVTSPTGWYVYGGLGTDCGSAAQQNTCFFAVYFDHSARPGVIRCSGGDPRCPSICKTFDFVTQ